MKHKEPEIVTAYYRAIANPPKCCHTCDSYQDDGMCREHGMAPPEEFAATHDACAQWCYAVPF